MLSFTVDITTFHRGFHGDLNETFFVGEVSDSAKKLVKTTHECLSQAIAEGLYYYRTRSEGLVTMCRRSVQSDHSESSFSQVQPGYLHQ